jgi:hypothetical protein
MRRGVVADACRIYGSLEGNKVQGDFHITARGHGYRENAPHLDHSCMCSVFFAYRMACKLSGVPYNITNSPPSFRLLAHDHGTLFRTALPDPAEPAR